MNLYDEYTERKNEENRKKVKKSILIAIIIVSLLIVLLIVGIVYLSKQPKKLSVSLNGAKNNKLLELLIVETDAAGNMQIYAPIKEVASYFGYEANNGSYTIASEDTNSCNVKNKNEVAIFQLDSNVLYKKELSIDDANYQAYTLQEKVFKQNDILFTTADGLEKAYNITISYDPQSNTIKIYTLDEYVTSLTTPDQQGKTEIQKYGYEKLDETFTNQKAIVDNMLVVVTETGQYGVIDYSTGKPVLGTQYDSITYIPQNSAFLIESNDKFGIIGSDKQTKIKPAYDSLQLIDNEKELYLASSNNFYGVVDINGNIIVNLEYDKIGIDIENFANNNITNGYILQNTLIPVSQGERWGFFDINGKKITDLVYDNVGCLTTNTQGASYNLLVIPEYNVIVIGKNEKYGCITLDGTEVVPVVLDDIYMQLTEGTVNYYMVRIQNENLQTRDITEYLEANIGNNKSGN